MWLLKVCGVVCCVFAEYQEEVKRLPIKFENPTFEGGKKGPQLYGSQWQQHINELLHQRYGDVKGIQPDGEQQQQQHGSAETQSKEMNPKQERNNTAGQLRANETGETKEKAS